MFVQTAFGEDKVFVEILEPCAYEDFIAAAAKEFNINDPTKIAVYANGSIVKHTQFRNILLQYSNIPSFLITIQLKEFPPLPDSNSLIRLQPLQSIYKHYLKGKPLQNKDQTQIAKTFIDECLKGVPERTLSREDFQEMTKTITSVYDTEIESTYFIPSMKGCSARGKLWNAYNNKRIALSVEGLISRRPRRTSSPTCTSPGQTSLKESYQKEANLQKYESKCEAKSSKRKKCVYLDHLWTDTRISRRKPSSRSNCGSKKAKITENQVAQQEVSDDDSISMDIPTQSTKTEDPYITAESMTNKGVDDTTQLPLTWPTPPHQPSPVHSSSIPDPKTAEEDTLFLLSLVKEIKKIPENNKLTAKIDILQTIRRWQTSSELQQPFIPNLSDSSSSFNNSAYHCPICYKIYRTKDKQRNHMLKVHIKNGFYTCNVCLTEYITLKEIVLHMKVHKPKQSVMSETSNSSIELESLENDFNDQREIGITYKLTDSDE